jgi:hypothetical protein
MTYNGVVGAISILLVVGCAVPPDEETTIAVASNVSASENQRIAAYVKSLYPQSAVRKSFLTETAEAIDCVDILSQPALNGEPLDSPPPISTDIAVSSKLAFPSVCPDGTVPVAKISTETIAKFGSLESFLLKRGGHLEPPGDSVAHEYAHLANHVTGTGLFAILNVWKPSVAVSTEFTLSQLWGVAGSGTGKQTVEAGWHVYPAMYGNSSPHLFSYSTSDDYNSTGCYNLCSRFVQTNSGAWPGMPIAVNSVSGGQQQQIDVEYVINAAGNWWLQYSSYSGTTLAYRAFLGYYPHSLFNSSGLGAHLTVADFGGEVAPTSQTGTHTTTDMGSGYFPPSGDTTHFFGYTAYQNQISYTQHVPTPTDISYVPVHLTTGFAGITNANCYNLSLVDPGGATQEEIFFGGAGYSSACPTQTQ